MTRYLGQILIAVLDGHEDPEAIRTLIDEHGVGSVVVRCSDVPGQSIPHKTTFSRGYQLSQSYRPRSYREVYTSASTICQRRWPRATAHGRPNRDRRIGMCHSRHGSLLSSLLGGKLGILMLFHVSESNWSNETRPIICSQRARWFYTYIANIAGKRLEGETRSLQEP